MEDRVRWARMRTPAVAFASAANLLARHEPFRSSPVGLFVGTLNTAIAADCYAFAVHREHVVGFGCWAVTDMPTAMRWVSGDPPRSREETPPGDVLVLLSAASEHPAAASVMLRHLAGRYPGQTYVTRRVGRARPVIGRLSSRTRRRDAQDRPGG